MRALRYVSCAVLVTLFALASPCFAQATVELPADEAAHPEAKSERWELAGHLRTERGRTFALLAAFRRGDHPALGKGSLLTLVIVDVDGGLTYADVNLMSSPFSAAAPGRLALAWEGSRLERLRGGGDLRLAARGVDDRSRVPMAATLTMKAAGPSVLLGEAGSRAFGSPANAAFQHATSRLEAEGTLLVDKSTYPVAGLLWFTHLWGPFDATGKAFDGRATWTAHLTDGRDLRVEVFRGVRKGRAPPPLALWVEDGEVREEELPAPPEVTNRWRSIRGILYPVAWRIRLPGGELGCRSRLPDGEVLYELRLYFVNWTSLSWVGSCGIEGTLDGQPVTGDALIEATGFAPPK